MTDREMLELAAKAIGLGVRWEEVHGCFWIEMGQGLPINTWNPLTCSADALELAVKLDLDLMRTERDVEAIATLAPHAKVDDRGIVAPFAVELIGDDKAAATRRAITRAAAAIQEAKEGV